MPNYERWRRVLMLEGEPDRVPLVEQSVITEVKSAFLGKKVDDIQTDVEFWEKAGYDHIPLQMGLRAWLRPQYHYTGRAGPPPATLYGVLHPISSHYSVLSSGTSQRWWAEEGKGLISTEKEMNDFPWPEAEELDYYALDNVGKYLPNSMKASVVLGYVYTTVWWLMGQENFYYAIADSPDLVAKMFQRVGEIQTKVTEIVLSYDCVGAVWMPDDIAYNQGLAVSPAFLRRYHFPWLRRIGQMCTARKVPYIYHSDGNLSEVLDDIIQCGFNALHPIQPQAMDIVETKRRVRHQLCIIGNIDLAYTLTRGTPQEVEEEVKLRIKQVGPGGGYCVSSANSITEYVPLANFNAMRETVFKYGAYPIKL